MITPEERDYIGEVIREDAHDRMLKFERANFCPVVRSQPLLYATTGINIDPRTKNPESSAERTLRNLGYTDNGGELWKPPIGEKPNFSLIDELRQQLADVSNERDLLRAASQWISRADRLPELHVIVALLDEETYLNTGGLDIDMHWTGAGYLCDHGDGRKYWTVFGENRAQCLDRVTHWMSLPAAPSAEAQS